MSTDCSLLCSLQLWTLKYAGLHERDISVHSYQHKPAPAKSSILPFMHAPSVSSDTDKATNKKAVYHEEFNEYFTSRSLPLHLSNRIFQNLRDKLTEFDQLLSSLKLVRTIWLRSDVVFLAFSNGTVVFIHLDKVNRTLKSISIDKTTLGKKFHITATIADLYLNTHGFYVIYDTLSKIDIFQFNTPIRSFHAKFSLANESTRLISEELPPYSNNIPVRRWLHIDHEHSTLTVWWSMLSEGISTSGHAMDADQRKSRFNCLSVVFPPSSNEKEKEKDKDKEKEKIFTIQTETSNPFYCSSTPSGLITVEMTEHPMKVKEVLSHEGLIHFTIDGFQDIGIHWPLLYRSRRVPNVNMNWASTITRTFVPFLYVSCTFHRCSRPFSTLSVQLVTPLFVLVMQHCLPLMKRITYNVPKHLFCREISRAYGGLSIIFSLLWRIRTAPSSSTTLLWIPFGPFSRHLRNSVSCRSSISSHTLSRSINWLNRIHRRHRI